MVFGVYAISFLVALLTAGRLSDHIGRRPVLLYFRNLFPGFIVSGLGLAFVFIPMSIGALTESAPRMPESPQG